MQCLSCKGVDMRPLGIAALLGGIQVIIWVCPKCNEIRLTRMVK